MVDSLYAILWLRTNSTHAMLIPGIVTDATDLSSFQPTGDTLRNESSNQWQPHVAAIRNFNVENSQVAFMLLSDDNTAVTAYIDDLCMEKCLTADISLSDVTQNSVTVSWTGLGIDTLICRYRPDNFPSDSSITVLLTNSPTVVGNLNENTHYNFSFANICGCNQYGVFYHTYHEGEGGNGSVGIVTDSVVGSIVTQPPTLPLPYCEDFENETDSLPIDWRTIEGLTPGFPSLTLDTRHSGLRCLDFYAPSGSLNHASLPPLAPGEIQNCVVTFYAQATNQNATDQNARMIVGVMYSPEDEYSFVPIDTIRLSSVGRWEQFTVDFSSYTGTGRFVSFRFAPFNAAYHYYIDDLYLGYCAISNVQLEEAGIDSLCVRWNNWHQPYQVNVEYGPQGFTIGQGQSVTLDSDSLLITGIDLEGSYDFYVGAQCSDTGDVQCGLLPATWNPTLPLPYCEDFEALPVNARAVPQEWNVLQRRSNATQYPQAESQFNGQGVMSFYPGINANANLVQLPPLAHGDSLTNKWVCATIASSNKNYVTLQFGYLTDTTNAGTFVQMGQLRNNSNNTLERFNLQLTGNDPVHRLSIRANSSNGNRKVMLDEISLSDYPVPLNVTIAQRGATTFDIRWPNNYGNPYYTIAYSCDTTELTTVSDSCNARLTGLLPNKLYTFYFITPSGQRLCDAYHFVTSDYQSLPYCNDFQTYNSGDIPDRWSRIVGPSGCSELPRIETGSAGGQSSDNRYLYFYGNSCSPQLFVLPDFGVGDVSQIQLSCTALSSGGYTNQCIRVGVMDDRNNPASFVVVDTLRCSANNTWQAQTVDFADYSGNGSFIALYYANSNQSSYGMYIDNIRLSPCILPELSTDGAHCITAKVDSNAVADYWIEMADHSFNRGEGDTLIHVTDNLYRITGLAAATTYWFIVDCDTTANSCHPTTSLTTASEQAVPLCDDFDSYGTGSNSFPSGWSRFNSWNDNSYLRVDENNGRRAIHFRNTSAGYCYAVMPDLAVDSLRDVELYLQISSNDNRYTALVVGVMDHPERQESFIPIDTIANSTQNATNWERFHVSLSSYRGTGRFVAFKQIVFNTSTATTTKDLYLDFLFTTTFPLPELEMVSWNSVRVYVDSSLWQNGLSSYLLAYGPHGFSPEDSSATVVAVCRPDTLLSGLASNTTFDFYAWRQGSWIPCGSCGSNANCQPYSSITTSYRQSLPYCDEFSTYGSGSDAMATGWSRYHSYSNYNAWSGNFYPRVTQGYNNYWSLRFYSHRDFTCLAAMPDIDIDSLQQVELYFYMHADNYNYQQLSVGVMDNPNDPASFVTVATVQNSSSNWEWHHVSLNNYSGSGRFIAFRAIETSGNWRYLDVDYVRLQECPQPTFALTASGSVTIFQEDGFAGDYWVEYGLHGFSQGTGTLLHLTDSAYTLTGLAMLTEYDFFTRCDSATPNCASPVTISTSDIADVPLCINFNGFSSTSLPSGWRSWSSTSSYPNLTTSSAYQGTGRSMVFSTTSAGYCLAVLPEMDIDSINKLNITLQLQVQSSGINYVYLEVGIIEDANDPSSFVPIDTLRNTGSGYHIHHLSLSSYSGNGRFLAFRERNASSSAYKAYIDELIIEPCDIPSALHAVLVDDNTVRIESPSTTSTGFFLEYGPSGFLPGNGTVTWCDALPFLLTLNNNENYDIYPVCDTGNSYCHEAIHISTLAPPESLPLCMGFDTVLTLAASSGGNTIYLFPVLDIDSLGGLAVSLYLKEVLSGNLEIGAMSDPHDPTTFIAFRRLRGMSGDWSHLTFPLHNIPPEARFLALRLQGSTGNTRYLIDNFNVSQCGVWNMVLSEIESNYITIEWQQLGTPSISVEYGPMGFSQGNGTLVNIPTTQQLNNSTVQQFTISPLDNLTNYDIYIHANCMDNNPCIVNYSVMQSVFTPGGGTGCIDPTNLTADYTSCYYGTFANPRANIGIVDYGYLSSSSRHTVHYNTAETDPRTGGLLHTVPPGAEASVRLGNWGANSVSPEAESIEYSIYVDPTAFDLLILKYAAVLQDPMHATNDQPRFTLEILNEDRQLISQCASADFRADYNMGWNLVMSNNVLWKDWTTVGIDMSDYANQTVFVRLTTYDCNEGSHYGYSYFTLGCTLKSMQSSHCGEVADNTFSAPSGFAYSWYTNPDSVAATTFSNSQTITVATNNDLTYYCDCAFIDNPNCKFTLSAFAGTRYPLALAEPMVTVSGCKFHVQFINNSTISSDGSTPLGTGEGCETAQWDFGNGEQSTAYNGVTSYSDTGTYTIRLVSGIAGNSCTDTLFLPLHLQWPAVTARLEGDTAICLGNAARLSAFNTVSPIWDNGIAADTIFVYPSSDSTFMCRFTDNNGCLDSLQHSVKVHYPESSFDTMSICDHDLPLIWSGIAIDSSDFGIWNGSNGTVFQHFDFLTSNRYGCDSVANLWLAVRKTTNGIVFDTIVENQLPYTFINTVFDSSDFTLWSDTINYATLQSSISTTNIAGCDSIIDYHLLVHRNVTGTDDSTVCESQLPILWNGISFDSSDFLNSTTVKQTILTAHSGADSTVTMSLNVIPTTHSFIHDTVLENQLPHTFMGITYSLSDIDSTHANSDISTTNFAGCDSIIHYSLFVHRNVAAVIDSTVCESQLPILWNGVAFDTSDFSGNSSTKQATLSSHSGADSLLTMHLHLISSTYSTLFDTIVENQLPYTFINTVFDSSDFTLWSDTINYATLQSSISTTNIAGCDSIIDYHLLVHRNVTGTDDSTVCESQLPILWNGISFDSSDFLNSTTVKQTILTAHSGADSTVTMSLNVIPTIRQYDTTTLCQDALPYYWRDTLFAVGSLSGTYQRNHIATSGCDSLCILHLTVNSIYLIHDTLTLCQDALPYNWRDTLLADGTVSSDHTIHRLTGNGCDSTMTLNLTVNPVFNQQDLFVRCDNEFPFHWRDTLFAAGTTSGIYTLHRSTTEGCDSMMQVNLTVNPTHSLTELLVECDSLLWQDGTAYTSSTDQPFVTYLNRFGCDSTMHLDLTLHYSHTGTDHIESCSPIVWIDGNTYTAPNSSIQHTIQTVDGCDSIVSLDLVMLPTLFTDLTDSFCTGNTYLFHGREITLGGYYTDTLQAVNSCDSIVRLALTMLSKPRINIVEEHDCDTRTYTLRAECNVDYLHWTATNRDHWNPDWGPENSSLLFICESRPLNLVLFADYNDWPTCPNSASVTLTPIIQPTAIMDVSPEFLTRDQMTLRAQSQSSGADHLQWHINGTYWGNTVFISYTANIDDDSLLLSLEASNSQCFDTVTKLIYIRKESIYAPNAFTPDEATNNLFGLFLDGIVEYELSIFNRQGLLLFTSTDPDEQWNGTYKGKKCPQGSYVWILRFRSEVDPQNWHTQKGTVTLIR